jgi:hypothetical protein
MDALTVAALALIALFVATPAFAYIDPGSGSMLVQLVTGGVAGALVLARLYWKRLKDRVTGKKPDSVGAGQSGSDSDSRNHP